MLQNAVAAVSNSKTQKHFVGVQLDPEAVQKRDPKLLCKEITGLAPVNAFIYFFKDVDVKSGRGHTGGTEFSREQALLDTHGNDTIDRLHKAATEHGVDIYMGGGELYWGDCGRFQQACQVDCFGQSRKTSCVNKPEWRAFQKAAHADLFHEHPYLAGFMFMHERSGPMRTVFKPEDWNGVFNPGCFCETCCKLGEKRGIDPQQARKGFQRLVRLYKDSPEDELRDGAMVALWRLLGEYPILAWESFQWDSIHSYRAELAEAMRKAGKGISIGCHFQHSASSADLPWRAGEDPRKAKAYADWVKPSVYPGCSGSRYKNMLDKARETYLRDCDEQTAHQVLSAWFSRSPENGREMLGTHGKEQAAFGPDWVKSEVRRFVKSADPLPTYAGLGIGIPGGEKADTVELITECTKACYEGGADGILISRHYSEMPADQFRACGDVIRKHM